MEQSLVEKKTSLHDVLMTLGVITKRCTIGEIPKNASDNFGEITGVISEVNS